MNRPSRNLVGTALAVALLTWACGASPTPAPGSPPAGSAVPPSAAPGSAVPPSSPPASAVPPSQAPIASPDQTAAATPTGTAPPIANSKLATAIGYVGDTVISLEFTDWFHVLGDPPPAEADRFPAVVDRSKSTAISTGALVARAGQLRTTWAFDLFDLDWEMDASGPDGVFAILQLRASSDVAPIVALLATRGYATETVGDATLYTHKLDPAADWFRTGPLLMASVAVIPAERHLLAASNADVLRRILDQPAGGSAAPGSARARAFALAAPFGELYSAVLSLDPAGCSTFAAAARQAGAAADAFAGVGPTVGTAIAFSDATGVPPVEVSMLYADGAAAGRDTEARAKLALGNSAVTHNPYPQSVMALSNGRVAGSALVFDGAPAGGRIRAVLDAWMRRDVPFAGCP